MAANKQTGKKSPLSVTQPPRLTRDRLLGLGASLAALLALISLTLPGIVYLIGLGYLAFALLGPAEKRDWRIRLAGWAFAVLLLATVLVSAAAMMRFSQLTPDDSRSFAYLSMGVASMILSLVLMVVTALAGILVALAFKRSGSARYQLLSGAGLTMVFYYVLLLPGAVVMSSAPPALGTYWAEPLVYGSILSGMLASAIVACAFMWAGATHGAAPAERAPRFGFLRREYLLLAGAICLLMPNLINLITTPWGLLARRSDETLREAVLAGVVVVSSLLYQLVLYAAAAAAFWLSCRRLGWKPSRWLAAPGDPATGAETAPPPDTRAPDGTAPAPQPRVPLAWAQRFFLTWRLPLLYAWAIVLVAACSFVGWYGFVAAAPAAAHYLWLLGRDRSAARRGTPTV